VHYVVAWACDTVAMPAATLEITGVRTEATFFKAILDKLGVDAEILQVGEVKGAGEPHGVPLRLAHQISVHVKPRHWINPPENQPTVRTLELPRDTQFVPQLSQSH